MDLVRLADERDSRDRRAQQVTKRIENENSELRFMANQSALKVSSEQKKNEDQRLKIEDAFSKIGLFAADEAKYNSRIIYSNILI